MAESAVTYLLLCASALVAGAVNAVAGGGTLLTFPSLLAVVSAVPANATSTFALLPGSLAGAWGYRQEIKESSVMLKKLFLPSLIGGILGSLAVTRFPGRVFETLVPWLLVIASTLMVLQKPLSAWIGAHPHAAPSRGAVAAVVFFQFLVGVYGGYFGAGIGILMFGALGFMGIPNIHQINGIKTVLAGVMNGVTVVIFMIEGVIVWRFALAMAATAIIGGYLGARLARRLPAAYVRAIVIAIGFGVAAYSFYRR